MYNFSSDVVDRPLKINQIQKKIGKEVTSLTHASIALFADNAALSYSSSCIEDLQHKLNFDLKIVACWLQENKLTLDASESKFMLIANSKKLKNTSCFMLTVKLKSIWE